MESYENPQLSESCDLYAEIDRLRAMNADLAATLKGAQSALRKSLPHLPPDAEAVYAGEWLDAIAATLANSTYSRECERAKGE